MKPTNNYITFVFKLKYQTNPGEEIYIFGDHPDFGNWEKSKFKLKWTEGHIIVYRRLRERGRENHAGIEDLCGPS